MRPIQCTALTVTLQCKQVPISAVRAGAMAFSGANMPHRSELSRFMLAAVSGRQRAGERGVGQRFSDRVPKIGIPRRATSHQQRPGAQQHHRDLVASAHSARSSPTSDGGVGRRIPGASCPPRHRFHDGASTASAVAATPGPAPRQALNQHPAQLGTPSPSRRADRGRHRRTPDPTIPRVVTSARRLRPIAAGQTVGTGYRLVGWSRGRRCSRPSTATGARSPSWERAHRLAGRALGAGGMVDTSEADRLSACPGSTSLAGPS